MKSFVKLQDTALLFLRLIVAAIFIYSGYAKLGMWAAVPEGMTPGMVNLMKLLTVVKPLGGVALIAGFLTRWAGLGLAIIMVGAFSIMRFIMHSAFFTSAQGSGLDYIVLLFGACLVLVAFGAGKFSVDAACKKS